MKGDGRSACFALLWMGRWGGECSPHLAEIPVQLKQAAGEGLILTETDPTDVLCKFSLNLSDSYLGCDL